MVDSISLVAESVFGLEFEPVWLLVLDRAGPRTDLTGLRSVRGIFYKAVITVFTKIHYQPQSTHRI